MITEDRRQDFEPTGGIERRYAESLTMVSNEVDDIVQNYFSLEDAGHEVMRILQEYSQRLFNWATDTSGRVIYSLNEDDKRKWRRNSRTISRELRRELSEVPIGPMMERYLAENVNLITSMPLDAARRVHQLVLESMITGAKRAKPLSEDIMRIGRISKNRAMLIARTETSRISTGLTKIRAEHLDLDWYVWRASRDVRVRHSHRIMDNVLVRWSEPPSPEMLARERRTYGHYHPGEIFNCRCFAQPVISVDDVKFPCKIHMNGSLQRVSRPQFQRMVGETLD